MVLWLTSRLRRGPPAVSKPARVRLGLVQMEDRVVPAVYAAETDTYTAETEPAAESSGPTAEVPPSTTSTTAEGTGGPADGDPAQDVGGEMDVYPYDDGGGSPADPVEFDSNEDGILDTFGGAIDLDGDGMTDGFGVDTDGDGIIDSIQLDSHGVTTLPYIPGEHDGEGDTTLPYIPGQDEGGDTNWDSVKIVDRTVSFERYYRLSGIWNTGGTYYIGQLVEHEGVMYVKKGPYMVQLELVTFAIEKTFSVGYGGEWSDDPSAIGRWFAENDASHVLIPEELRGDQRAWVDRLNSGPLSSVGALGAASVLTMIGSVAEAGLLEILTTYGPVKALKFVEWAGRNGISVIRNGGGEILHFIDGAGNKLTKEAYEALSRQFSARESLFEELVKNGVKHSSDKVVVIGREVGGKIVFLEAGNAKAGLQHIISAHGADFARRGIPLDQISDAVMAAVTRGKQVGMQGTRPIYEVEINGQIQRIAVTVGDNGFIVGANPAGI